MSGSGGGLLCLVVVASCYGFLCCKVVIYNYLFCWLELRAKFDCNFIQSFVSCI